MNHFHFASQAVARTRDFYIRYFGFRERAKIGRTLVLENSDGFLLALDESRESSSMPENAHLGFRLKDAATVDHINAQMRAEGTVIVGTVLSPSPRARQFYCLDPSGNRIEVGWYDFS